MPYPGPGVFPGPDLYPGEDEAPEGPRTLSASASFTAGPQVDIVGTGIGVLAPVSTATTIRVRSLPPLRMYLELIAPSGQSYRWAEDEAKAENVFSGLTHSSTMPGGYEALDVTLPRETNVDYADLERLSTVKVWGTGGDQVGEYRLERVPSVSGDQMSISPSAVGWQAHLEDDKSASMVFIDRDLSSWYSNPRNRVLTHLAANIDMHDSSTTQDTTDGLPAVVTQLRGTWTRRTISEAWYDAGSANRIEHVRGVMNIGASINLGDTNYAMAAFVATDENASSYESTADLNATGNFALDAVTPRRFAMLRQDYLTGPAGASGTDYPVFWTSIRLVGDHGLTLQDPGASATEGLLGSDMVTYAVNRWAPLLNHDTITIPRSTFAIPHAVFKEPTTAGEMIRQLTRFGLEDWGVWNDKEFFWTPRNQGGRSWRARVGPAQLEQTGQQVDRLWESIVVAYQDETGKTRTVGPPGSAADVESTYLKDTDPDNPANRLGIIRRDRLTMGTSTSAGAIEIGRRFLEETKLLDRSGRATIVGHVMDDRGILRPYYDVRAGDDISFVDAADTSPRRIVRAAHSRDTRSCSVDLDAPPEGLQALLERLGVALVPLGFNQ